MDAKELEAMMDGTLQREAAGHVPTILDTPKKGQLTERERWLRVFREGHADRIPDIEFGYWHETVQRWHGEGLPERFDDAYGRDLEVYFGLDRWETAPVNLNIIPSFKEEVLEDHGDRRIVRNGEGAICEVFTDGASTIPRYLQFAVHDRASWLEFKKRLDPDAPGRIPEDWDARVAAWESRTVPLGIMGGSLYGWVRNWMGFEGAALMLYDDPWVVEDAIESITDLSVAILERVCPTIEFDYCMLWEDMCFKNGPMISPMHFKKLMVPRYRRITDVLRKHGCDIVLVDCDGCIHDLVGLWLEAGVNVMFPVEIHAGTDPQWMRNEFGRDMKMAGGIDKVALSNGKEAIDAHLEETRPLVEEGFFVPHVDHRVPPDISYEDYLYYLQRKREAFGIV